LLILKDMLNNIKEKKDQHVGFLYL
jgi:hypothetical protein